MYRPQPSYGSQYIHSNQHPSKLVFHHPIPYIKKKKFGWYQYWYNPTLPTQPLKTVYNVPPCKNKENHDRPE